MRGVEQVFHLAGRTSACRRSTLMRANGHGTLYVTQACAQQATPPLLIHVSSIAAAGPADRGQLRREEDRPRPISHYGHSKRAGEVAVERLAHQVPTTIVRPGIVFGEGGRETLPIFQSLYRFRLHAVAGYGSPPLSVIHVADLVELLERAAAQGSRLPPPSPAKLPGKGVYFACRPEYPDYLQFGRMVQRAVGRRFVSYLLCPNPLPWLVGGLGSLAGCLRGHSGSLNFDKIREATVPSWACCCEAARRDLGFQPRRPLPEQLRDTAQWYLEHGWL